MCTLFLAVDENPQFPIILIENRDEFFNRKSTKPHQWEDIDLYAGKDFEKGGTWLGYNSVGDWGVVTNYRDLNQNLGGERSRGDLIPELIGKRKSIDEAHKFLLDKAADFGPFNLVYSIENKVFYFSSIQKQSQELQKGIYGLSNAFLNTPWFKVTKGKRLFSLIIENKKLDTSALFKMMLDEEKTTNEELPPTGLPLEIERLVSSIFIFSESYGTHCTTFLSKDKNGKINFEEKRYQK